jgi:probable HAF family extracellular repeat protein
MKTRYRTVVVALFAISAIALCLFLVTRRSLGLYRVTILPSLGGDAVQAHAINDRGEIVGIAKALDGLHHLFLWDREHGMQDLGATADTHFDINNSGQIAGAMADPNGNQQACLWEPGKPARFLGTLGGKASQGAAINNRCQIAGVSDRPDGSRHAFFWDQAHGMRDLGTLGDRESYANAINDAGHVLGVSHTPQRSLRPFIWDPNGGMAAVDSSQIDAGFFAINNGSWLAGQVSSPPSSFSLGIWRKGVDSRKLLPLDRLTAGLTLLNDANQVVFSVMPSERSRWIPAWIRRMLSAPRARCYLWDPNHGKIRLDPYLGTHRTESFISTDINSKGCIIGVLASGPNLSHRRSILLEPIPKRWGRR